jgi:hypothetical protein
MENKIYVKHSYNAGDLIVLMCGLKELYRKFGNKITIYQVVDFPAFYYNGAVSPIIDDAGQQVCMNMDMFNRLKPLIEYQEYIESFEIYEGQQVHFNIDLTRDSRMIPMPAGLIHHYAFSIFPEMSCDLSKPWIECPNIQYGLGKKIIFNRTQRYQNAYIDYYFLKQFQKNFVFAGIKKEYEIIKNTYSLDMPILETDNFLDLASMMKNTKGGLYNQSFLWHLADAMKLPRVLELCVQFPNTFPTGANGYSFYHQSSLEYFTKKLINNDL